MKSITISDIKFKAFVAYIGSDGDLQGRLDYEIVDDEGNTIKNDSKMLSLSKDDKATILTIAGQKSDEVKVAEKILTQAEVDAKPSIINLDVKPIMK